MTDFTDTTGELGRAAGVTTPTVRKYADSGLLEFITISNGVRLFKAGQADRVREIYRQRMAARGRKATTV